MNSLVCIAFNVLIPEAGSSVIQLQRFWGFPHAATTFCVVMASILPLMDARHSAMETVAAEQLKPTAVQPHLPPSESYQLQSWPPSPGVSIPWQQSYHSFTLWERLFPFECSRTRRLLKISSFPNMFAIIWPGARFITPQIKSFSLLESLLFITSTSVSSVTHASFDSNLSRTRLMTSSIILDTFTRSTKPSSVGPNVSCYFFRFSIGGFLTRYPLR